MPATSILRTLRGFSRTVWILLAGTFINRFGTFVMPFLVIYLTRRGYSVAQAGLAVSVYGAGHLIASIAGGHLADRMGRRRTIVSSMFLSAIAMMALARATGLTTIIIVTFLAGIAAELYRPAAGALLTDLVGPEHRVVAFGMYRFAVNLGFAFGSATAGFLADRSFLYLFLGDSLTSIGFGVIALLFLPVGVPGASHQTPDEGYRVALRDRTFVLFLLSMLCVTWIQFQIQSVVPLYLQKQGFSLSSYGLLMSLNGVLIVCFEIAILAWTRRFDPRKIIATGYALLGIGVALTGLAHTIPTLAATVVVWTLGEMIFAPTGGAYAASLAPERYRGRYQGLYVLSWSVGMLAGPALGTAVFAFDPRVLWVSCAGAALLGAATLTLVRRGATSAPPGIREGQLLMAPRTVSIAASEETAMETTTND